MLRDRPGSLGISPLYSDYPSRWICSFRRVNCIHTWENPESLYDRRFQVPATMPQDSTKSFNQLYSSHSILSTLVIKSNQELIRHQKLVCREATGKLFFFFIIDYFSYQKHCNNVTLYFIIVINWKNTEAMWRLTEDEELMVYLLPEYRNSAEREIKFSSFHFLGEDRNN